ncbi:MAG: hypothetical protein ACPID7_00365, partial [Candidatus Puniceispirillum sp.]
MDGIGLTSPPMAFGYITGRSLKENGAASVIRTRDLTLTKGECFRFMHIIFNEKFILEFGDVSKTCPIIAFSNHRNSWQDFKH